MGWQVGKSPPNPRRAAQTVAVIRGMCGREERPEMGRSVRRVLEAQPRSLRAPRLQTLSQLRASDSGSPD